MAISTTEGHPRKVAAVVAVGKHHWAAGGEGGAQPSSHLMHKQPVRRVSAAHLMHRHCSCKCVCRPVGMS